MGPPKGIARRTVVKLYLFGIVELFGVRMDANVNPVHCWAVVGILFGINLVFYPNIKCILLYDIALLASKEPA